MRLQHFLALAGVASRRQAERLITTGHVRVNQQVVAELGTRIDPSNDVIDVDGERAEIEEKIYVLLNKPRGYLSTVTDPRGRRTVNELVADLPGRLYPVGRLDMDTRGVLLMTNDGELCHRLTHPRFGVKKVYHAEVRGKPSQKALRTLRQGVGIEEGKTSPAKVRVLRYGNDRSLLEITIREGRKRQVKRMCENVGYPVLQLDRVEFGGFRTGDVKPGHYRILSKAEVARLKKTALPKSD